MQRLSARLSRREWIVAYGLEYLLRGPYNHRNAVTKARRNLLRNQLRQRLQHSYRCTEDNVPTLDIRGHLHATGFRENAGRLFHREPILSGEIDTPQQRDVLCRFGWGFSLRDHAFNHHNGRSCKGLIMVLLFWSDYAHNV